MIKASALGDIIHALPTAAYLKSCSEVRELHWLVEEPFAAFLSKQSLVDKLQVISTKKWRRQGAVSSLKGVLGIIKKLRRERFDLIIDFQGNSKSGMFTFLSGSPLRFGFNAQGIREWPNLLATNRHIDQGKSATHIIDKNLALATSAVPGGSSILLQGPLQADIHLLTQVKERLSAIGKTNKPLVIFHYGTTWQTKLWSVDRWIELGHQLWKNQEISPLLTWGNEKELEVVKKIAAGCPQVIIWPRGNLEELMALLSMADVVVGGDTGPIHIAAALGTPTVSYYRATNHQRNGPRGDRHICIQAIMSCSPCLQKSCPKDEQCRQSIPAGKMVEAVKALLAT